jgi:hypothetical protein
MLLKVVYCERFLVAGGAFSLTHQNQKKYPEL